MKILKNLFGRGDKIHVDEIVVAPGQLLGGAVIVESGSNENGEYIRFGNGWQICVTRLTMIGEGIPRVTTPGGTGSNPFPKPFVHCYKGVLGISYESGSTIETSVGSVFFVDGVTGTQYWGRIRFILHSGGPVPKLDEYDVGLIAIGRWK